MIKIRVQLINVKDFETSYLSGLGKVKTRKDFTLMFMKARQDIVVVFTRSSVLVREKKIEGISKRYATTATATAMRVVIELRRDAVPDVVLNQLYRFTALPWSFGTNMVALVIGRPLVIKLKDLLQAVPGVPRGGGLPAHRAFARPRRVTAPICSLGWRAPSPTSMK